MRDTSTPLLQTSRGGRSRESSSGRLRRLATLALVVGLTAAATTLLPGRHGGSDDVTAATAGGSSGGTTDSSGGGGDGRWSWRSLEVYAIGGSSRGTASGDTTLAEESESLAEAHKRARKAAALPKPEFRSSATGMSLNSGAAAAAAVCAGDSCDAVARFVLAAASVRALAESGGFAVQHCPDALGIGLRPLPYTAHAFGNRCEPLYTRGAVELVRQMLLGAELRGLEWFSGSSTSWLLARLAHLTSIEAAPGFAAKARGVAEAQFEPGWLAQRWDVHVIPPARDVRTFEEAESAEVFGDYCTAAFLPAAARFDFISVQGFARMACLRRAVALLRPQGGLLVLPQAQRPAYAAADQIVPHHWLRFSDSHSMGQTVVWMSVLNGSSSSSGGGGST